MLPTKRGVGCPPHFPALRAADSCRAKRSSPGGRLNSLRKIRLLPTVRRGQAKLMRLSRSRAQPEQHGTPGLLCTMALILPRWVHVTRAGARVHAGAYKA